VNQLQAIKYLIANGPRYDEWAEAWLLQEVDRIVGASEATTWTAEELDKLIKEAQP
jgi:hypothetical protein